MLPLPARPPESSITDLGHERHEDGSLAVYWTFYWRVAEAQLDGWLPSRPARILDISGPLARTAAQAAASGHTVLRVRPPEAAAPEAARPAVRRPPVSPAPAAPPSGERWGGRGLPGVRSVIADVGTLRFLSDGSADAVIAEDRTLSRHLVTETTVGEIARVLRPGGRVLLSVDSLMLGMAILAEQNYWAHLSDVPRAEVVLVPWPDGMITRCFWPDQLRELLGDAGFEIEWMRPRTVLSPSTVEHILTADPQKLPELIKTELTAQVGDEAAGIHLVASARRR